MFLKKLSVIGFKNIPEASIEFTTRLNCFVGGNGAGKTNVIDAVHYLSMGKSAFTMTDLQSINHGGDFFMLDAEYKTGKNKKENVVCSFKRGSGKAVKRNGKQYDRLSDHIGLIPLVIISPADAFLVTNAADDRRKYLNAFISQLDKAYLNSVIRYNHVLGERNRLLKQSEGRSVPSDMMEVFDMQLAEHGNAIYGKRKEMIARLAPVVADYYRILSDDREQVELIYDSELNEGTFEEVLRMSQEKDRINQFTTSGVHRDDMKMKIGGYQLRKYGSQGQQKSFLVALKLAQYAIVFQQTGEKPILLLDDLFDKLDMRRVGELISLVSGDDFGQIFITDCNKNRLLELLKQNGEEYAAFDVENGNVAVI